MSISSALSSAYSGLSVMSRSAETISNNVSNALTEGYSRQQVELSAAVLGVQGSGVKVDEIARVEDRLATLLRRNAAADLANTSTKSEAIARLTNTLGEPGDMGSLAVQYAALEESLSMAISAPDSASLLQGILHGAKSLATTFNNISTEVNRVRTDSDTKIAQDVEVVNSSLRQIESLNAEIRMLSLSGRNVSALRDQRQIAVDRVNEIIPIRQTKLNNGEIAVFSQGGEVLLNGSARNLEFTLTNLIDPSMSLASGALSGLSINGKQIDVSASDHSLVGGSLAANFLIRDSIVPEFQMRIDALSADLIERFQSPSVDLSLTANDAGLFTDFGGSYDSMNELGISSRISVNTLVDPSFGGEVWRLRDGIGAPFPGPVGESDHLIRMADALAEGKFASANIGLVTPMSGTGFAEEITSLWATHTTRANEETAYNQSIYTLLRSEELHTTGVDTDKEMQSLLLVEQAYAANARVISVLDGLMKKLMEI